MSVPRYWARPFTSLLLLLLALSVSACSGSDGGAPTQGPPEAVRRQMQAIIESTVAENNLPGMVIQVVTPGWTWTSAAGNARSAPPLAADGAMYFRIASVSKTFTAVAVLKLAEEGKLNLDDPIEKWLPRTYLDRMSAYRYHDITLRLLLNHRSGIPDYNEDGSLIPLQMSRPTVPVGTDVAIFEGLDQGPLWDPGAAFDYSNVNYLLLSRVIDSSSGMSYENYVRSIIIEPLGLTHTFMSTDPPTSTLPDPFMRNLYPKNGQWNDYSTMYLLWDRGAGDITSTAADLNTFHMALRRGRIINEASLRQMENCVPTVVYGPGVSYGLGYMKIEYVTPNVTVLGHQGGYPGSDTRLYYLREKDTYVVTNGNGNSPNDLPPAIAPVVRYLAEHL